MRVIDMKGRLPLGRARCINCGHDVTHKVVMGLRHVYTCNNFNCQRDAKQILIWEQEKSEGKNND